MPSLCQVHSKRYYEGAEGVSNEFETKFSHRYFSRLKAAPVLGCWLLHTNSSMPST